LKYFSQGWTDGLSCENWISLKNLPGTNTQAYFSSLSVKAGELPLLGTNFVDI